MTQLSRPARPCRHCRHHKFVHARPREVGLDPRWLYQHATQMRVTFVPQLRPGVFEVGAAPIHPLEGIGILEQYICARCGAVDWYCVDPQHIPIHAWYMTEDIDYEPSGSPYR